MEIVVVFVTIAFVMSTYYFRKRLENIHPARPFQRAGSNQKFYMPDDSDLKPAVEYLTFAIPEGGTLYRMIVFTTDGVTLEREGVAKTERDHMLSRGNWQQRAERQLVVGGKATRMSQYERPRLT